MTDSFVQSAAQAMQETRALCQELRDTLDNVKTYALNLKDRVLEIRDYAAAVRTVHVDNFPDPAYPNVAVSRAFGDLTTTGDVVAAQGTGINIRVVAAVLSATAALSVKLQSDTTDITSTIRVGTASPFILPVNPHGWAQTGANKKLALAFVSGTGTLSYHVLWVPV